MSSLYWLLSPEAMQVRHARERTLPLVLSNVARAPRPAVSTSRGRTVVIKVEGTLTQTPDLLCEMFGEPNTTYPEIKVALAAAMADDGVSDITWEIDSGGGTVEGMFELLDAIEDARAAKPSKPMRAMARNAHSAAYGIAAAVGEIHAVSRMSGFGSVGVATTRYAGPDVVDITSTDAPDKRPNPSTPEGQAVVRAELDQIATEFMGSIARGRGITPDAVAAGYGRGASMLARAALAAGMIDHVADARGYVPPSEDSEPESERLTTARTSGSVPNCMATEQPPPALVAEQTVTAPVAVDIPVTVDTSALSDADRAELAAFRADKAARETAERRDLITQLVALGAETPATAFANGAPVARLASEPLAELRTRVAALSAGKSVASALQPPATAAGTGEEALEDYERKDAAKIVDPEARARFVAGRLARKQK